MMNREKIQTPGGEDSQNEFKNYSQVVEIGRQLFEDTRPIKTEVLSGEKEIEALMQLRYDFRHSEAFKKVSITQK